MRQRTVVLAVTGGIAAYKACEVLRGLQRQGVDVRVVMSEAATRFVGVATFEALSGHRVVTSLFGGAEDPIAHISLAGAADACVVVPATANVIAKMAQGLADDALSTTLLAMHCPLVVAPAMNVHMWQHPATQANLRTLRERGVRVASPEEGRLACSEVGEGKLANVDAIVGAIVATLAAEGAPFDLAGRRVTITAGPTHEALDPVRFIANASSGKMGFALAAACAAHGAEVELVAGPTSLATPCGAARTNVTSAAQMHEAALRSFEGADAAICCAAVADYTPQNPADHKLKKATEHLDRVRLRETDDILRDLCALKGERVVFGFAAETADLLVHAREKLDRKGADLIVANDVSRADSTFGADTKRLALVSADGTEELETLCLPDAAEAVVRRLARLLGRAR